MDSPEQCIICLENFTQDKAYIPKLNCNCAIFVHWDCWEPWTGECLYCRSNEPINIQPIIYRRAPIIFVLNDNNTAVILRLVAILCCFYFFIITNHNI